MFLRILMLCIALTVASGCSTAPKYDNTSASQSVNLCGEETTVAIESDIDVSSSEEECEDIQKQAKDDSAGSDFLLRAAGYAPGFALGLALF